MEIKNKTKGHEVRCIFCKQDSSNSKSVEHIVPESLGNSNHILPPGVVCDSCNNYFAVKVEKPLLESGEFKQLRFNQRIKNKKGKTPLSKIIIGGEIAEVRVDENMISFHEISKDKFDSIFQKPNTMYIPCSGPPPSDHLMSRFLAKMALESFASRWLNTEGWNDYIVEHDGLEPLRKLARYPKKNEAWCYSKRRIYNENKVFLDNEGVGYQSVHELDFLVIDHQEGEEYYFVVAIFGMEYAINCAGDSLEVYEKWLIENENASPLHTGKNAISHFT